MAISSTLPYTLTNGTTADATQVMADLQQIQSDVNANAAHNGANSDITSLTGLTTPLATNLGGTGATTATGTGANVLATSPAIVTPTINSAASVGGTWTAAATWTLPAFTLGGAVTATGQTITGGTYSGATLSGTTTLADGGTLTSGANTFKAPILYSATAATVSHCFGASGSTTAGTYASIQNTTGNFAWGVEGSAGSTTFNGSTAYAAVLMNSANTPLQFGVNNAVVATLDASGRLMVGSANVSGEFLNITGSVSNLWLARFNNGGSTNPFGLLLTFSGSSPNNTSCVFLSCQDTTATRFVIYSNGNIVNTNNSYGAISDPKTKLDIVRAGSQWNDTKELAANMVKYHLRSDPTGPLQLGFISQDVGDIKGVRSISPGLVGTSPDTETIIVTPAAPAVLDDKGNVITPAVDEVTEQRPTGTVTDHVQYSIASMKAFKALGEALERIEALDAQVAALQAKVGA